MDKAIPDLVIKVVEKIDPQAKVILFGSRARGDFHEESDWDFLILTPQELTTEYQDELRDRLYELELDTDQVITSIIENEAEWEQYANSEFYANIQKDGIEVQHQKAA